MPYRTDGSDVPKRIKGKKARRQWAHVWNGVYQDTNDESRAFAAANSVYNRRTKKADAFIVGDRLLFARLEKDADDSLYEDTGVYDSEHEGHVRSELEVWADYSEDGPTFDPDGDYLCGTCDMRLEKNDCMRVVSPISFDAGSCRLYTKGEQENEPEMPQKLTQIEVAYTERPNVKGFSCARCMFSAEAKKADDDGRPSWCGFWGVHVQPKACCFKNTGDDDVYAPLGDSKADKVQKNLVFRSGYMKGDPRVAAALQEAINIEATLMMQYKLDAINTCRLGLDMSDTLKCLAKQCHDHLKNMTKRLYFFEQEPELRAQTAVTRSSLTELITSAVAAEEAAVAKWNAFTRLAWDAGDMSNFHWFQHMAKWHAQGDGKFKGHLAWLAKQQWQLSELGEKEFTEAQIIK